MSKCKKELSEKERERLLIRRASGANASQLAHMEKMLQETKGLLEKKTETDSESKACGDTMGVYLNLQVYLSFTLLVQNCLSVPQKSFVLFYSKKTSLKQETFSW